MKVKTFLAGMLTMTLLLCSIGTAHAIVGTKTINAEYQNITIKVNGDPIVPKDAQGKYVEPFAIEGTTYLPVRAVAEAFGMGVEWNEETTTIKLTTLRDLESENIRFENYCIWSVCRSIENTINIADKSMIYVGTTSCSYDVVEALKERLSKSKATFEKLENIMESALAYSNDNSKNLVTIFGYWNHLLDLVDKEIYKFGMYCTASATQTSEKYLELRDSYNEVMDLVTMIENFEMEVIGEYFRANQ